VNVVFPRGIAVDEANASGEPNPLATLSKSPDCSSAKALPESLLPQTSERLAQLSQAGCADSFEELVSRFETQIFNFLRQFTRNVHDAEDLTQETFVKAYRNLPRYKPTLGFAPWLFTIARRTAASHFRALRQFEELPPEKEGSEETPATALEQKDETSLLWKVVRSLKARQAEAIWLRYAEGFSVEEIARIMQTNRVYVKVLLHRARTNLSKVLSARRRGQSANLKETMKELL
jgi:RNA polymerase sigma factor (sigma-70 family)